MNTHSSKMGNRMVFEERFVSGSSNARTEHRPHGVCTSRAFTLVELLVVIAIIAVLMGILLPMLGKAREEGRATACAATCRDLGVGMTLYFDKYDAYPAHQWRLNDAADTRIRWYNAFAMVLDNYRVTNCPSTPEWEIGRNNSYGYNYKYLGSARDNTHEDNPFAPFERYPVRRIQDPSKTIAFADSDGTGWDLPYQPPKPVGDQNPNRFGNHGYVIDPTYIPAWSVQTYSGGALEPYAWTNYRSNLSDRHNGKSMAVFADGHCERIDPRIAYRDNSLWNGLGYDPDPDGNNPDNKFDRHVSFKWDSGSGQAWRY